MCLWSPAKIWFCSAWSQSSRMQGRRLMPQEFRCCSNTLSALYSTIWTSPRHENIPFPFWCIACRHMGQSGTNVIPREWCSSHLGPSFELLAQRLFRTRQKMGTEGENCPALIRCKKTRTEDHFSAAREDQKLCWQRAGARGDGIAGLSFHSQTSVKWLHLLCGLTLDTIIHYCTLTLPSSLTFSCTLAATGQKPLQLCANNTSVRYCFVFLLTTLSAFTYIDIFF